MLSCLYSLYFLPLWFLLGIVYPTLRPFWPFSLLRGIPAQWLMNMAYASIGYGVLGYYLKKYRLPRRWAIVSVLAGFAIVFFGTWLLSLQQGEMADHFLSGMTVGVCLLGIGIDGSCLSLKESAFSKRMLVWLAFAAKASFCIFLVHVFFLYIFRSIGLSIGMLPCLFSIPLLSLLNLLLSTLVYCLLSRLPVVKDLLI